LDVPQLAEPFPRFRTHQFEFLLGLASTFCKQSNRFGKLVRAKLAPLHVFIELFNLVARQLPS
jgi:hypothetical protein